MSELLDLSSAGILPSLPPSTCQLPYHRCSVRRGLSPCRASQQPCSPLPVAACHLRTPHPITSSLSLSLYLSFPSHFLAVFFKASQKEQADDLHELACDSHIHTLLIPLRFICSFLLPLFLFTGSLFSSVSFDPASSVILTLRSQSASPPILLESSVLSPFSCLHSLCSAIYRRQIVLVHY